MNINVIENRNLLSSPKGQPYQNSSHSPLPLSHKKNGKIIMTQYDFELYDEYIENMNDIRMNIKTRLSKARSRRIKRLIRRELRLEEKMRNVSAKQLELYLNWLKKADRKNCLIK